VSGARPPIPRHPAGLCGSCTHHRTTGNRRGSLFYLCQLAKTDPGFRRYPPLPMIRCVGYTPAAPDPWDGYDDDPEEAS
jgi:hypothetical protein